MLEKKNVQAQINEQIQTTNNDIKKSKSKQRGKIFLVWMLCWFLLMPLTFGISYIIFGQNIMAFLPCYIWFFAPFVYWYKVKHPKKK